MNNTNNTSIHEFEFNLICEYFAGTERQGPGSPEVTRKALSFIENLSGQSRIADLGCGTGSQTLILAGYSRVTGVDLFPGFIEILNRRAKELRLEDRVKGITGSMKALPFRKEEFDLIWSEGAIYNIGFQRGLNEWRKYLKPGGYIAVSEVSWLTAERPDEINDFWMNAYPEIDTIPNKVAQVQKAGYIPVATFILPENCWTEHFYNAHAPAQENFLKKYAGNTTAEAFVAYRRREAGLYQKYKAFYGYVFYIGKKI